MTDAPDDSSILGEAAQSYAHACDGASKAWARTTLMGKIKPGHVFRVREALETGSAEEIGALVCDIGGPLHPGTIAQGGQVWQEKGTALAQAAITAILLPLVAARDARQRARQDAQHDTHDTHDTTQEERADQPGQATEAKPAATAHATIEAGRLRECVLLWIDTGRLPPDVEASEAAQAHKIADWLQGQLVKEVGHKAAAGRAASQRLAVLAMTAPPVQSLVVMARLPAAVIDNLQAQAEIPEDHGSVTGVYGHQATAGPLARTRHDDDLVERVANSMAARALSESGLPPEGR